MLKEYSSLISELREKIVDCSTQHDLANIKSFYLGKNGIVPNEFLKLRTHQIPQITHNYFHNHLQNVHPPLSPMGRAAIAVRNPQHLRKHSRRRGRESTFISCAIEE